MSFADQIGNGGRGNPRQGPPVGSTSPQWGHPNSVQMNSYQQYQQPPRTSGGYGGGQVNFDSLLKTASENVQAISSNIQQIRHLSETLGTSRDTFENRERLRHFIDTTRITANDTTHLLKELHDVSSTADQRKRTQYTKLTKDFQTILQQYQEISKYALQKEKSTPMPAPRGDSFSRGSGSYSGYTDTHQENIEKKALMEAQRIQQLQIDNERAFNDALIADREQGIKEIEKSIVEVNEIFQDLAHLVVEQGAMIDNIESNIEDATVNTTKGVEELRSANEYQKKSRTKMCCLALILLVIAAVAVLVVYFLVAK